MGRGLQAKYNAQHHKFLELFAETRNHVRSYRGAGYHAKTDDIARQNACRLLRQLDKKLDYREILDSVGLSDRRLATRMKELLDDKDGHLAIKSASLISRSKGWQQTTISIGVGMETNITGVQGQTNP